jgi:dipicolinic acid synthetase, B subunit
VNKMTLSGKNIGIAITGSFCTYDKIIEEIKNIVAQGANVYPILSYNAQTIDCRFGKAQNFCETITTITGHEPITTIVEAEPLGPKNKLDILIIAPCTGNTLAKLQNGITDTPVLMAAKGHLRNNKPLVISIATNDALSMNFKNIGELLNSKHFYFVPFGQDNYKSKPNSMIAHTDLIVPTLELALEGEQLQPVICAPL